MRWFRLGGIPAAERLDALRLQVEAWRPFDALAGRLVVAGDEGLAIVWDAVAVERQLQAADLSVERCQVLPETLLQVARDDGLHLLRVADGYEAQHWQDGQLRASRWWAKPLSFQDWQEFVHASGATRDAAGEGHSVPTPHALEIAATTWAKHYSLHASGDASAGLERRAALGGAVVLSVVVGALGHQLWDVYRQGNALAEQIAEVKTTAAAVLSARDATTTALGEVEKLAAWYAVPQPIDVIGHLHDALARSGVQIKDLDLEGNKLRLGLQLTAYATRAGIVKDLQAGGWFTDVAEVRADNARGLLVMEMRIAGARPPSAAANAEAAPAAVAATGPNPAAATAALNAPVAAAPQVAAPAAPVAAPAAPLPKVQPSGPPKPIIAKPDANGMPPADVFNAIPNR
ncbi:hypothetical protein [Roseateles asaccharophilus]|uniref:Uncharacterized protein n=1 Tax=Roseateles asaccharophilus TaxID=582607 RepID=A0ABU2AFG6_9BURK|nr:hypothetical protein [Roseateles asaccharophilus]MDR7334713.1 hypothetical protein [Roseateles asaccharophilus]